MCAIAGMIDLLCTEEIQKDLLKTMTRRGPDAADWYQKENAALLHARLAVIDLAGGAQPMEYAQSGERYCIVYNGELYNTEEVRKQLQLLGHGFRGHSDTEVVLHAYAQWGEACLEKFNGIFAFGIWEENRKRLFLARDRMGVKPLFYKLHQGGLLFASEIKTILKYPTVKARLDEEGAAQILLLGPGRVPGSGVFRGIAEMEPGCCGYFEEGNLCTRRYWKLKDREHRDSFEDTAANVRELVTDAIRRQMVSDVPIGTFLSGGLDSSLITAICAREQIEQGKKLATFSVDYADNDRYFVPNKFQPNSDGEFIRLMQNELQTEHHWCVLTPKDLLDALEDSVAARDLPGMADVDISLLAFCRKIKERVTVALSGECADEIFGGYPWFRDKEIRDREGFPWSQNIRQRQSMLSPSLRSHVDGEAYVRSHYEKTCRESDILPGTSPEEIRMKQMVNLNQQWFMQTLLDRKDRMSMYSGLEVRVPFCDHRIAEYLYGVPWEFKDYNGREKGLLRHAMAGVLPDAVLWRKKSPYPKTFDPAYLQMVSARLETVLEDKNAPLFELVDREAAMSLLNAEYAWPWYGQLMKVPQTICYLLQINSWMQMYHIDIAW